MMLMKMINFKPGTFGVSEDVISKEQTYSEKKALSDSRSRSLDLPMTSSNTPPLS